MAKANINGKEYDVDTLPAEAKRQLQSVAMCDRRIQQLKVDLAIAQTARNAYAQALQAALAEK